MTRLLLVTLLSGALAVPMAAQGVVGREDATWSLTEAVARGDWIRVATPNGSIRIAEGSGARAEIRAEKNVRRGSVRDAGFVVRREDGGVTVCAVYDDEDECAADGYRGGRRSRRGYDTPQVRIDFTVRVPAGVRVRAASGNGDVSVSGGAAETIAATGNGRLEVSGVSGAVRASTGNGTVTVEGAGGPVHASTGSGSVRITTSTGPVNASTGNGSIDVSIGRLTGSPDMRFTTGNGRILVRVPEGFGAELEASTGSGEVLIDFPMQVRGRISPRRISGTIGGGGGRLVMTSGNGDVEIRRQR